MVNLYFDVMVNYGEAFMLNYDEFCFGVMLNCGKFYFSVMLDYDKSLIFYGNRYSARPLRAGCVPSSPRSRSAKSTADAKLEKTSLSAGGF